MNSHSVVYYCRSREARVAISHASSGPMCLAVAVQLLLLLYVVVVRRHGSICVLMFSAIAGMR